MKTRLHFLAWSLLGLALAVAGIRLAVIASTQEIGWETIAATWRDAALGWTGWSPTTISQREPPEQAEFWLREVDRILSQQPESAELCMGAAWVLDSPGTGYVANHFKKRELGAGLPPLPPELDTESVTQACSLFETACRARCLKLAARATELEPNDVRWWRMRAILLFAEHSMTTISHVPRDPQWLRILDECSRHDPDNALYGYLAVRTLWDTSAEVDWDARDNDGNAVTRIRINDKANFEEGLRRLDAAQKKPFLAIGEAGIPAIVEFLSHSRFSRTDQAEVAVHREINLRQTMLFQSVYNWLAYLAGEAEQRGEVAVQMTRRRQQLQLFQQAIQPKETSAIGCKQISSHTLPYFMHQLQDLAEVHSSLIEKGEFERLDAQARANLTNAFVLQQALAELEKQHLERQEATVDSVLVSQGCANFSALSLMLACLFFVIAMLLARRRPETPTFGFTRGTTAWLVAIILSIVLFGLMPAEIISRRVQAILATIAAWSVVLTLVGYVAWKAVWHGRQRRFQFRILTLLGCMVAVAVFGWIWPVLAATASWFSGLPAEFHVPAKGWSGLDPAMIQTSPQLTGHNWRWCLLQWNYYLGPYLAVAFGLALIALWYIRFRARKADQPTWRYWSCLDRPRWAGLFRCLAKSAMAAGLCALLIYLWLAPAGLQVAEDSFQYRMGYCRDPAAHIAQIEEAEAKILASKAEMQAIREQVDVHFEQAREEATAEEEGSN